MVLCVLNSAWSPAVKVLGRLRSRSNLVRCHETIQPCGRGLPMFSPSITRDYLARNYRLS